jgi:hypothetical protein
MLWMFWVMAGERLGLLFSILMRSGNPQVEDASINVSSTPVTSSNEQPIRVERLLRYAQATTILYFHRPHASYVNHINYYQLPYGAAHLSNFPKDIVSPAKFRRLKQHAIRTEISGLVKVSFLKTSWMHGQKSTCHFARQEDREC